MSSSSSPDPRDRRIAELEARNAQLQSHIAVLKTRIAQLEGMIERLQRGSKRQAAPFSKGPPKVNPKTPGRKSGDDYGTKAYRAVPPSIDEEYEAPLPDRCPHCGQRQMILEGVSDQYHAIVQYVRQSPWVVSDETGWRIGGNLAWLHVGVSEHAVAYLIACERGYEAAKRLIGAGYAGKMVHDGWAAYLRFLHALHQACLAHLSPRFGRLDKASCGGVRRCWRSPRAAR